MTNISAQVSLYPLGQKKLSLAINEALQIFGQYGLQMIPGPMSAMIFGDDEAIFSALQTAFRRTSEQGRAVMVVTFSNACPVPGSELGSQGA
jgi:uncharacterized protein YqgV (UPF0045/DUF77 family)